LSAVTGHKAAPTLSETDVRCDILERDWAPPPRPADCEFRYGAATPNSSARATRRSAVGSRSRVRPAVRQRGVGNHVRDTESGRGFTLSRERYEMF
jgi:hypothetical protein